MMFMAPAEIVSEPKKSKMLPKTCKTCVAHAIEATMYGKCSRDRLAAHMRNEQCAVPGGATATSILSPWFHGQWRPPARHALPARSARRAAITPQQRKSKSIALVHKKVNKASFPATGIIRASCCNAWAGVVHSIVPVFMATCLGWHCCRLDLAVKPRTQRGRC